MGGGGGGGKAGSLAGADPRGMGPSGAVIFGSSCRVTTCPNAFLGGNGLTKRKQASSGPLPSLAGCGRHLGFKIFYIT